MSLLEGKTWDGAVDELKSKFVQTYKVARSKGINTQFGEFKEQVANIIFLF